MFAILSAFSIDGRLTWMQWTGGTFQSFWTAAPWGVDERSSPLTVWRRFIHNVICCYLFELDKVMDGFEDFFCLPPVLFFCLSVHIMIWILVECTSSQPVKYKSPYVLSSNGPADRPMISILLSFWFLIWLVSWACSQDGVQVQIANSRWMSNIVRIHSTWIVS